MRQGSPRVTLILPIYNERENIRPLIGEIESALAFVTTFEVIAIDDGSTDGSSAILREMTREKPYLKAIFFRRNSGQTAAFDAGFRHASGEIVVTLDSDLQNDPNDIPKMISLLDQGYDFVAGWRRKRRDGFFLRTLPSRIANRLIRFVTGTRIHDLGCSLKVFRRETIQELRLYGEMHRFIGVLAEGIGARVCEYEVNHRPRIAGESKYGIMRTFKVLLDLTTVWFMQGYRTKPIYIFGGAGFGLISLGAVMAVYVGWEKMFQGIYVHRNPLFILATVLTVIGVQFLGLGLLAEMMTRTYFESQNKSAYSVREMIGFTQTQTQDRLETPPFRRTG